MSGTRSRVDGVVVCLALAWLPLLASCLPSDSVEPEECPGTPCLTARLSPGPAPEFYVSPNGSPSGDGSFAKPWDLATALDGPTAVIPGSTIWLRGGTYTSGAYFGHGYLSNLSGTPDAPIVVRQYPGERATVTKFLEVRGEHTWYWGFELVHPAPHVGDAFGISTRGPGTKLINLVVHDASLSGVFIWPEASDAEVYGSIFYNNGRIDNHHGVYCQSQTSLVVEDNLLFDNWAAGIHCFTKVEGLLQNIDVEGNVAFNNSLWSAPWQQADIIVGGHVPASGITINENYTYRSNHTNNKTAETGHEHWPNQDLVCTNNYFAGGWWFVGNWSTATVTGNTLYNFGDGGMVWNIGNLGGHTWSDNTFFGDPTAIAWRYTTNDTLLDNPVTTFDRWLTLTGLADPGTYAGPAPAGVKVVVRPNRYEPGRANIIVYNWAGQGSVSVDVSGMLSPGDPYVVQHTQDFYGAPVASGLYTGDLLELPMVSITPPIPLGTSLAPAPVTGPTFNAFVLMTTRPGPGNCLSARPDVPARCTLPRH